MTVTITSYNLSELPKSFAEFIISPPAHMQNTLSQLAFQRYSVPICNCGSQPELYQGETHLPKCVLYERHEAQSSIVLFVGDDCNVYARFEGAHRDKIVRLLGTDTARTAFTVMSCPDEVFSVIQLRNPGITVSWQHYR